MIDIGYDTHNPILILRTLSFFQGLIFIKMLIMVLIWYPLKTQKKWSWVKKFSKRQFKSMGQSIFFGQILILNIEGQIELMIAGNLYWRIPENNPNNTTWVACFAFYYFSVPLLIPFVFFWMFSKNLKRLRHQKFQKRWGVLTEDLKL